MAAMPPKPAWKTYTMVALAMFPSLLAWLFWVTYIAPKVHHWWDRIVVGSTAEHMAAVVLWMAYWSNRACNLASPIFMLVFAILLVLELALKNWWPRWRLTVLTTLVILCNTLILLTLTMTSVVTTLLVSFSQKEIRTLEKKIESGTE